MKITLRWLKSQGACLEGMKWFNAQKERDSERLIYKLQYGSEPADVDLLWAVWLKRRTRGDY